MNTSHFFFFFFYVYSQFTKKKKWLGNRQSSSSSYRKRTKLLFVHSLFKNDIKIFWQHFGQRIQCSFGVVIREIR